MHITRWAWLEPAVRLSERVCSQWELMSEAVADVGKKRDSTSQNLQTSSAETCLGAQPHRSAAKNG